METKTINLSEQTLRHNPSRDFQGYVDRVESMAYIKSDDSLWQVNDSTKTAGSMDRFTQEPIQEIPDRATFFGSEAGINEQNFREIETIASDCENILYLVNTVNNRNLCGIDILDVATIYKLERASTQDNFAITDWQVLPSASLCEPDYTPTSSYSAMVIIDGNIYFGSKRSVYLYNYSTNEFENPDQPILATNRAFGKIRDMSYEDGYLWVLSYSSPSSSFLTKYNWENRTQLVTYSLDLFELTAPRALVIHNGEIFIGENANTNPNIHVFEEPSLSAISESSSQLSCVA